ncbi:MAG: cytochrome c oxidase subunit 3 [Raineya sp.]|jgi:cytochrome c oxidase subunit 3|nr:cytochrome c oxidase subunit 3 [Raineya sp.]
MYQQPNEQTSLNFYEEPEQVFSMHPKKFMMWLFIVSIAMIFASLTSAYIFKQSDTRWLTFDLPEILGYSSVSIALSSVSMQLAYYFAKKNDMAKLKINLFITVVLGMIFLGMQWEGWVKLVEMGIYVGGVDKTGQAVNVAGSFVYVLMGVHAFHLITGLLFLIFITFAAFRYQVHSKSMVRIEMCTVYWHFLGGLWIYLYFFLLLNR